MHMVILAVEFHQRRFKVGTYLGEDFLKVIQNGFCEYAAAVFRHKDQMDMHLENTVSAVSYIVVIAHRPEYD